MKIATWNINSLKVRLPHVLDWLAANQADVLCLQETKCPDAEFPAGPLAKAGYSHAIWRGMKGYNGVAILSRRPLRESGRLTFCGKEDARHIAAEIDADTLNAVLEEGAKFAENIAFPLNQSGDLEGCTYHGAVHTLPPNVSSFAFR